LRFIRAAKAVPKAINMVFVPLAAFFDVSLDIKDNSLSRMKGEQGLKTIRKKIIVLSTGIGLGFIVFLCLLFQKANVVPFIKEVGLIVTILLEVVLALFLIRTIRSLKIAKLIMENQILHIQSDATETFISCFGMLLNEKVIKFNLDRTQLIKVEIGGRYIEMTYGTHNKIEKTRIR